jgi:hypothetical protein
VGWVAEIRSAAFFVNRLPGWPGSSRKGQRLGQERGGSRVWVGLGAVSGCHGLGTTGSAHMPRRRSVLRRVRLGSSVSCRCRRRQNHDMINPKVLVTVTSCLCGVDKHLPRDLLTRAPCRPMLESLKPQSLPRAVNTSKYRAKLSRWDGCCCCCYAAASRDGGNASAE